MARLFVVSGPSGVGKSTLLRRLVAEVPGLSFVISHTTRPKRAGEVEGRDYHFVSEAEFDALIEDDAFVEWAVVHANRYGTSRSALAAGGPHDDLLIEVDVQGAEALQREVPAAVSIFIAPPDFTDLEARLTGRGRESAEEVRRPLSTARRELPRADAYDHVVVNRRVEETVGQLKALVLDIRRTRRYGARTRRGTTR